MRIKQINPRGWYDIPGYDGKYQINYFGNVRRALKCGYKALHPYIKTTNGRRVVKLNCKDNAREINKAVRRIELDNREDCSVNFKRAPDIVFDF